MNIIGALLAKLKYTRKGKNAAHLNLANLDNHEAITFMKLMS